MSGTLHEDLSMCYCCATLNVFVFLTVPCSSTIHREFIVAFPLQQWLHKHTTMLCYTYEYISYFVFIQMVVSKWVNITVCIIFQWHLRIKFLNAQAFQRKTMVIIWCGHWKKEQYIDKTNVKMMCIQFWELM